MQPRSRDAAVLIAALVWLLAFGGHFFAQPIASDVPLGRLDVLADSGWLLLDNISPPPDEQARNSGWRYFPQRFDLLFVAATMLLAAWSAGQFAVARAADRAGDEGRADRIRVRTGDFGLDARHIGTRPRRTAVAVGVRRR